MIRFPGRRISKALSSGLTFLAVFTVVISMGGALDTVFAADGPRDAAKASQVDQLDVPGSFKELPVAKDAVTAKRSTINLEPPSATRAESTELTIDSEKVSAPGGTAAIRAAVYADIELVNFDATAYCLKGRTASGVNVRPGVIAADPRVLPLGTVVHLRAGSYTGTYTVLDTGGRIKGRRVDVYVPTHKEAMRFGRRQVKIKIVGHGSPRADRASKNLVASEQ
jgi:3D (Asp-Asp-Asp) domain-containing protein